jgi:hypothetical protein
VSVGHKPVASVRRCFKIATGNKEGRMDTLGAEGSQHIIEASGHQPIIKRECNHALRRIGPPDQTPEPLHGS